MNEWKYALEWLEKLKFTLVMPPFSHVGLELKCPNPYRTQFTRSLNGNVRSLPKCRRIVMRGWKKVGKSTFVYYPKSIFLFFSTIWIVYFQNFMLIGQKMIFLQNFKKCVSHAWNLSSHTKCMGKRNPILTKFLNMSTYPHTLHAIFILKIF